MTNKTTAQQLAAKVIARAREAYGKGAAAFDYEVGGTRPNTATDILSGELWTLANEGYDDGYLPMLARALALQAMIADELGAYRQRCRTRKYTGWSGWSTGPIRYAD